jgi:hypothetical protein
MPFIEVISVSREQLAAEERAMRSREAEAFREEERPERPRRGGPGGSKLRAAADREGEDA